MKLLISLILLFSFVARAEDTVRIGWQVPWATQGQIVQVLKHTDILKKNGLKAEFVGKTFGPELNELAMAGAIDVVLTADQPAITLFSKDKGWKAIGRLMYNRTATYVPPSSPIQKISDLKGKTVGVPIGAAAERVLKESLKANGVALSDVKFVNLGIMEHGPLIQKDKDGKTWGQFDALSGFDPAPAILQSKGLIRVIDTGRVTSMVLMNEKMLKAKPAIARKMMLAVFDAYDYYRQHTAEANTWFLAEAGLKGGDQKACELAAELEPNLKATKRSDMSLTISSEDLAKLKDVANFLEPQIKKNVDVAKYIDDSAAKNLK